MLKHVFLGILKTGGDGRADWSTQRIVQINKVATGTSVLTELYVHLAEGPGDPGLAALFERLGVSRTEADLQLADNAPDAGLPRALMARHGH